MAISQRIRAKERAKQIKQEWGDEYATARRYSVSVGFLRKDRARPDPIFPFVKIPGFGRGGGAIRYCFRTLDQIMERNTHGQDETATA